MAKCPKCKNPIPWKKLRIFKRFSCDVCRTVLEQDDEFKKVIGAATFAFIYFITIIIWFSPLCSWIRNGMKIFYTLGSLGRGFLIVTMLISFPLAVLVGSVSQKFKIIKENAGEKEIVGLEQRYKIPSKRQLWLQTIIGYLG